MIEVLVSDWGGVLTTPLEGSFRHFAEHSGMPLERLGAAMQSFAEQRGEHPLYALERGEMTEQAFLTGLEHELGVSLAGFADVYFEHLEVNATLIERLRGWKARGLRLALCTNNIREWEPRWRAMLPIDELFEVVVDSAFVGVRKPDAPIYAAVLERLGSPDPATCVFLDDIDVNCAAARDAGMHAVQFHSNEQALAELDALLSVGRRIDVAKRSPSALDM